MRAGEASTTAQHVAALRLTFERASSAVGGDPGSDEALARDVAGNIGPQSGGMLDNYLAARTSFFDRVVVSALDGGIDQVVIAAAGYDGRAFRYGREGVRWFEVDHPDTQRDKLERVRRLSLPADHIAYAAADFAVDDVAVALAGAGHDGLRPSLFVCEGVAVYLDEPVLASLLRQLRQAAAPRSRLAISLSVTTEATEPGRRERFQQRVADLGEPAQSVLTADDAEQLFVTSGWKSVAPSSDDPDDRLRRARHAGFVVATPVD